MPNLTISSMEWDNEIYSATPTGGSASSRQWYYKAYSSDSWHSFTNNSAYYTPSASEVGYSYQVYYSARSG
ncbi:MAG: hypothetical protein LBL34_05150, partial [Clostridiales bacterium]|nr:hypothetical protein [Clostridiales bacterium]